MPPQQPGLLVRHFLGQDEIFGDTGRDEGGARGVAGADVAPVPFGDLLRQIGMTLVVGTFSSECCVGDGVGTGLGEDVAPVTESVAPGPEAEGCVLRKAAQAPAGPHELSHKQLLALQMASTAG